LPTGLAFGDAPGEYVNKTDGSILLYVPGGPSWQGDGERAVETESDTPRHCVTLSPFFIGKLEVTNAQFDAFVKATRFRTLAETAKDQFFARGHDLVPRFEFDDGKPASVNENVIGDQWNWRNPSAWFGDKDRERLPVVQVMRDDAVAYCSWARLTLPTEAQWERAARGPGTNAAAPRYPWGPNDPEGQGGPNANLADAALRAIDPTASWDPFRTYPDSNDGFAGPAPVGSFPADRSPEGMLDVIGNVREITADAYDARAYKKRREAQQDPLGTTCSENVPTWVSRGGSWCSNRNQNKLTARSLAEYPQSHLGFRVARSSR
jgi:formylglycine-generating enzyme required for sulfatase activity